MAQNTNDTEMIVQSGTTLKIHNGKSILDSFYHIDSHYQITYECCSGIEENDYLNVISLSPLENSFYSFSMKQYGSYNKCRPLHYHDFYEFMVVLDGQVIHKIEDKEYLYGPGSGCLINRNIRHTEKFNGETKLLFLDLSPEFISELFNSYTSVCFNEEISFLNGQILNFIKEDTIHHNTKEYLDIYPVFQNTDYLTQLHTISDHLMHTLMLPGFGSSYMMKAYISSLIEYFSLTENYHITQIQLEMHSDFLLFTRISHLIEDTNGRITRNELENSLHYSGDYISRMIRKYTGMNLFDYCMTFCLKRAAYLLSSTDCSVSAIMSELNFSNHTHFYELFKKTYGMTPGAYRKKHTN